MMQPYRIKYNHSCSAIYLWDTSDNEASDMTTSVENMGAWLEEKYWKAFSKSIITECQHLTYSTVITNHPTGRTTWPCYWDPERPYTEQEKIRMSFWQLKKRQAKKYA